MSENYDDWHESTYVDVDNWPNCPTPDCEWKVCTWAGTDRCGRCSRRMLGEAEFAKRYRDTHGGESLYAHLEKRP